MKNRKDDRLPKYVYRGKSAYEFKPYLGPGIARQTIRLCGLNVPISEVWEAYEKLHSPQKEKTIGWLLGEYLDSRDFARLAPNTRGNSNIYSATIRSYKLRGGGQFESVALRRVTPGLIRRYLDSRAQDGSPVSANREVALLSAAWRWARERDYITQSNPLLQVRRNPEKARDRYVTDQEYEKVYELAPTPHYLRPAMELAYLCRMRRGEVIGALKSDMRSDGLMVRRLKGSRDMLTIWTPRLRDAVDAALNSPRDIEGMFIIQDKRGRPIKPKTFGSAWHGLKSKMVAAGIEPFNFHDLKSKGATDFKGDKQAATGHRTVAMVARYNRPRTVEPTR